MPDLLQNQGRGGQPAVGVVYNTSMDRPDAALALAALYVFASKMESRVNGVCVGGASLDTAIFCDVVARFYGSTPRSSNTSLPVGLAAVNPMPPDSPMVEPAIARKKESGDPQYARGLRTLTDTALAEAMLRNAVTFTPECSIVLSGPATWLMKSLDILGSKELYAKRVKRLVLVDAGGLQKDPSAMRRLAAEWPTPIVLCGREIGEALAFPAARLETLFAWAPANPVVDAYKAFKPMPYDAPMFDVAAVHFAVHPESGLYDLSEPGSLSVGNDGGLKLATGDGSVRRLIVNAAKRSEALEALVAAASTKPTPPPAGRGRGGD
jgi:purine nucleosidase